MGSFCSSDDKSTSTTAPDPRAAAAYGDILSRAQQVGSQPYSPYGGQLTAGLDPTQQAGISNINQSFGMAMPWFNQAGQYAQQGAGPVANISGADIQNYYNPYQQAVIDATMGNINEADQRQQQMVKGNAAMSGALGGDRQAVAQAELARQQGLARNQTLAGLQSQGYSQALAAAQSQQANQQQNAARALQGAGVYGNLGAGAQQAQLQGAGAQLGAGQIAQQTEQARLSALYNQFQQQQAFPYQQLGWLAGISAPIGSQMGQTTTVDPADPSMLSQIIGLGATAAGAFAKGSDRRSKENIHRVGKLDDGQPVYRYNYKGSPYTEIGLISQDVERSHPEAVHHVNGMGMVDYDAATADAAHAFGGRVGYADGGPTDFISDVQTYIPRVQIQGRPLQPAQFPSQDKDKQSSDGSGGLAALANLPFASMGSGMNDFSGGMTSNFGFNSSTMPGYYQSNYGTADQLFPGYGSAGFADGGLVDTVRALRKGLKSYQNGGDVFEDRFRGSIPFEDRWDPVFDIPQRPEPTAPMPFMAQNQPPVREFDGGNWSPQEVAPQAMSDWRGGTDLAMADAGGPRMTPIAVELPPEITAGASRGQSPYAMPSQALGYDRSPAADTAPPSAPQQGGFLGFLNNLRLSDEASTGLMAAGLGMMAARSPYALSNIGEGGLQGLKAMAGHREEARKESASKRSADAEARRMLMEMKRFGLEEEKLAETKWQHRNKPVMTTDERGVPIMLNPLTGERIGKPAQDGPPIHTPQEPLAPAVPPPAPIVPGTPKPAEVMVREEEGLPPNAQFVADTSGKIVQPWVRPEALEGIPPKDQEIVRAIAEGRRQFLPLQRNNPYNRYIMEKVHEYDPQADQTIFGRRQRTQNFFAIGTQGGGGQNIAAMNTFGQHAQELYDLSQELDMGRFPSVNAARAWFAEKGLLSKATQDKLGKWQVAAKAVADEGAKVFAGSQSALADREAWHKVFDPSNPKTVTQAKLQEVVKLIDGRLNSLAAQYNDGMRTNHAPIEFVKPRTREIFEKLRGGAAPPGIEQGSGAGAAPVAKPEAPVRFKQLIDGGMSKKDAYETLRKEGY